MIRLAYGFATVRLSCNARNALAMRVLFLTQYFAPEVGATQSRTLDMARALVDAGHEVVLICEVPNHPKGVIWPEYRGKVFSREQLDGIDVVRVWVRTSPEKTGGSRIAFYLSYMVMAVAAGLALARGRFDVVFATSPPLFVAFAGVVLSILRRTPFVAEVRDLWPAAAEAMGELRNASAIAVARWMEKTCYRRARRVITVTQGWRSHLLERGVPASKVALVPNGANTKVFHPRPQEADKLRASLGCEGKFVAVYVGLHGLAQGLEVVLKAALRLRENSDIAFVLVGEGPRKEALVRLAEELSLPNVAFLDEVPRETAAAFLSMADLALVPLRGLDLFKGQVPAKLYDAWACGCPVVAAGHGELAEVVRDADGGICVGPEDDAAMADAIRHYRGHPEQCLEAGENARKFILANYTREAQARSFVSTLNGAVRQY